MMSLSTHTAIFALLGLLLVLGRHRRWIAPVSTVAAVLAVMIDLVKLLEQ